MDMREHFYPDQLIFHMVSQVPLVMDFIVVVSVVVDVVVVVRLNRKCVVF